MIGDIVEFYGIIREFKQVNYLQTEQFHSIYKDLTAAIRLGNLIVLTGIIGAGKSAIADEIQQQLKKDKEILVAESLTLERTKVNMATLTTALFADLANDKEIKIPSQSELRERKLRELIQKRKKPVAFFIDDAHGLHNKTLVGLKHLMEIIQRGGGTLSVILIGHPKLKHSLSLSSMEEIGARALFLSLETMEGKQLDYINWILDHSIVGDVSKSEVFTQEALDLLAKKLATPLQINQHLWKSLVEGYKIGQKPIELDVVQNALSPDLNGLESKLVRMGYNAKVLCETISVRPAEIRSFLKGKLSVGRTEDITEELRKAGVPL